MSVLKQDGYTSEMLEDKKRRRIDNRKCWRTPRSRYHDEVIGWYYW
jgi:hypothetical protein